MLPYLSFLEWMYITDWRLDAIIKLHKLSGELEATLVQEPQTNRLYGVKVYSSSVQTVDHDQPCSINNGGCEKLCFATPTNTSSSLQVSIISNTMLVRNMKCPNKSTNLKVTYQWHLTKELQIIIVQILTVDTISLPSFSWVLFKHIFLWHLNFHVILYSYPKNKWPHYWMLRIV